MYSYKLLIMLLILSLVSCANAEDNGLNQSNDSMDFSEKSDLIVYKINDLFNSKKSEEALNLITKHSKNFNLEQTVGVGSILYSNGYFDLSKEYFEKASLAGNAEALYRLGYYYNYSEKEKNIDLSLKYFKASIDAGYLESNINLGEIYLYEDGYVDLEKAKFYFEKAINLGMNNGYYGLGEINLKEGNFKKAKEDFDELKKNGYYLEYYDGCISLHSKYKKSEFYNIDLAKKYIDLIAHLIEDQRKNEIIADFYEGDHKYKDLSKSNYYRSLSLGNIER